jgi:hypothetical protein
VHFCLCTSACALLPVRRLAHFSSQPIIQFKTDERNPIGFVWISPLISSFFHRNYRLELFDGRVRNAFSVGSILHGFFNAGDTIIAISCRKRLILLYAPHTSQALLEFPSDYILNFSGEL